MNIGRQDARIAPLYERLSRDDELQGVSNSIINQKKMLEDYAEKNGFFNPSSACLRFRQISRQRRN